MKNQDENMIYDENVDYESLEQHTYDDAPGYIFYTCPKCGREYLASFIIDEYGDNKMQKDQNNDNNDLRLMGAHLRFLRTTKTDLNQAQLAELLNIDRSTYAKYESGMSQPGIKTIKSIAKVLGESIDSLLNYGDNEYIR